MPKFEVEMARIGTGTATFEIEAPDLSAAVDRAQDEAGNHLYSEKHSEYVLNGIQAIPEATVVANEPAASPLAQYVQSGGCSCPHCANADIAASDLEMDGSSAWSKVTCAACGATWNDVYELRGVSELKIPFLLHTKSPRYLVSESWNHIFVGRTEQLTRWVFDREAGTMMLGQMYQEPGKWSNLHWSALNDLYASIQDNDSLGTLADSSVTTSETLPAWAQEEIQ